MIHRFVLGFAFVLILAAQGCTTRGPESPAPDNRNDTTSGRAY